MKRTEAEKAPNRKPLWFSCCLGSFSGCSSTILLQPLDLIKTRMQNIQQPNTKSGLLTTVRLTYRTEKLSTFWRGLTPSLLRVVPGVAIYFGVLESLETRSGAGQNATSFQDLLFGASARCCASLCLLPITVLKTRFESVHYNYSSLLAAFKDTIKRSGSKGLFSGLTATILRDAPFSGFYLMFYRAQLKQLAPMRLEGTWSPLLRLCCGVVAGVGACLLTQPFDMVKTQVQLFPSQSNSAVIQQIYKREGLSGFFRGFVPRATRRTLFAALSWTVYEELQKKAAQLFHL